MRKRFKEIWGNKKIVHKFLFCVVCSVCVAFLVSLGTAAFYYARGGENKGKIKIEDTRIRENRNIEKEKETYIVSGNGGKVEISFPEKLYINKLQYLYRASQASEKGCEIKVYTENIYGDDIVEDIEDNFFPYMARSVINVKNKVSKIVFEFPKEDLDLELFDFVIDNSFKLNPFLAGIVMSVVFVILFLFVFYKENVIYPGVVVFICITVLSGCMLCMQPAYCSGWDEEIHFFNSYNMAVTFDHNGTPSDYLLSNYAWLDFHHEASLEEHIDMIRLMNRFGEMRERTGLDEYKVEISSVGYIAPAIGISIGRFLRLPFYFVWILGKFFNVLLYAIGMSVAISIIPIGKKLLMVISLFPIMIFQSTTYTYDITVIVFLMIGISIWIKEILNKDSVFSYKWRLIYFICMVIGCMPKAVYAPLLLGLIFMPETKFYNSKDKYVFKGSIIVCFVLLMSTFVIPTLLNPAKETDIRGGNTSVSKQLKYIFHRPIAYGMVLMKNIEQSFVKYITGDMFNNMAYVGEGNMTVCYSLLIACTAITDTYKKENQSEKISVKDKVISLLVIFATIVLIWTALYLSFTEVGKTVIAGVQGRYYLPFVFLFYLLFRNEKIVNKFAEEKYQVFITSISCVLLVSQIMIFFFMKGCV